jgi:fructan beta-fructosidase
MGEMIFPHPFKNIYSMRKITASIFIAFFITAFATKSISQKTYHELYRPQIHFSPKEKWTNDPNGMVYYKGIYHLFFQYFPDSTVWGPMHWGHATSTDLIHWDQQPIALYPDSLGYIFSGSAVVDKNNSSGLGKIGQVPLVAIYTSHSREGQKAHRNDYENQSIAYSLDHGKTWKKYDQNPVLKNPGITDFRDPKVMWYEPGKKWVMTLATKDRVTFFSSPDLKNWKKESEFGQGLGAHGGVWECPDLFSIDDNGRNVWVLIANINPGGPNSGSATQYFVGSFDGNTFTTAQHETKWLDYGPDDYAGITWSNTGNRRIFLGWMSNWLYANRVPTLTWRNAMTIPRELKIKHIGKDVFIASEPVRELNKIEGMPVIAKNIIVTNSFNVEQKAKEIRYPCRLNMRIDSLRNFSVVISNDIGDELLIGYDQDKNQFYIDRTKSGETSFQKDFAARHTAPRFIQEPQSNISLVIDQSSVELFADNGLTVMTEIFFPNKPYDKMVILTPGRLLISKMEYLKYNSIWPN